MPKMPDSPSPSVSESPAATESPSVVPDEETPEEFVRRWQAAGDEMQVTGETDAYRTLGPKCQPCAGFADAVEEIYADGGRIEFEGTRVLSATQVAARPATVQLRLRVPETVIREGNGSVEQLPASPMRIEVTLGRAGQQWVVTHYVGL